MSEVYNGMYLSKNDALKPIKEEVDLDEATSQVLAHGGKGQYKVTSGGGVTTVKFKGKVVSSGDFDQGADGWFMNIKGEKGQKFFDTAQEMADYFAKNKITEEADLDEGTWYTAKNMTRLQKMIQKPMPKNHTSVKFVMKHIGDDDLMDNMDDAKNGTDLSPMVKSAMKRIGIKEEVECDCDCGKSPCEKCGQDHHGIVEAVSMAQQAAIAISKKERGNKPKKEEVKLDELKPPSRHVGKSQKNPDMFAVYDQEEKEVELFKDKKDAEEYAVKNHDALMGHDKSKNVKEQLAKIKGSTPGDQGRRAAVEDDIERAKNKGDDKLVKKLKEDDIDEKKKSTAQASLKDVMALDKKNAADKKQSKKDKKRDDANRKSNRAAGMEEVEVDEKLNSTIKKVIRKMAKKDTLPVRDMVKQAMSNPKNMKEEDDIDEASKEGTVKIIKTKDGKFQIQKMTKGKFADIGKPYNSQKEAEKFRSGGQPNLFGEEADLDEARGRPRKDGTKSDTDDREQIQMQLRKSISLRGLKDVVFDDGKKVKISARDARDVLGKLDAIKAPKERQNAVVHIAKSHKNLVDFAKGKSGEMDPEQRRKDAANSPFKKK